MKHVLALVTILVCAPVCAPVYAEVGDLWISPYSTTKHYRYSGYLTPDGEYRPFEDSHPSIGLEYQYSPTRGGREYRKRRV